ncbi:SipW-dependent-type signal peptide-containing protein [Dietzia maris]|uniref:SipW-dependent-type signal peptide-containing protein n=1 Tax=Dietzia maris TaxID=37915 RepID=UPI002330C618|nr:SipW-dependent-type signal peptide-containing protein [Dietzia maris]
MDATTPLNPEAQRKQDRARKRKAILAGGVVLGLGAAVTLAAWSDDIFADGTFSTSGKFVIEGATGPLATPGTFSRSVNAQDVSDPANALELNFPVGDIFPGDTNYAPFTIKTSTDTTLAGALTTIASSVNSSGGLRNALDYSIASVSGNTCDATAFETPGNVLVENAALPTTTSSLTVPLAAAGATPVKLCIAVTFPEGNKGDVISNGGTVASTLVTWKFTADQDS